MPRKRKGLTYKKCEICQMGYTTSRPDVSKYCERPACAQKAYRLRKKEKEQRAIETLTDAQVEIIEKVRAVSWIGTCLLEYIEKTHGIDALRGALAVINSQEMQL